MAARDAFPFPYRFLPLRAWPISAKVSHWSSGPGTYDEDGESQGREAQLLEAINCIVENTE